MSKKMCSLQEISDISNFCYQLEWFNYFIIQIIGSLIELKNKEKQNA